MKASLRDIAEIIGLISIVGSLIFVGLEIRQAEQEAANDRSLTRVATSVGVNDSINQFPDIWRKGNLGQELDDDEKIVYRNLLQNYWWQTDALAITAERLGRDISNVPAVTDFSSFLFLNPGARQEWIEFTSSREDFRDFLVSDPLQGISKPIILDNLSRLDAGYRN